MKFKKLSMIVLVFIACFSLQFLAGCSSDNPVSPNNNDHDLSKNTQNASNAGLSIYQNISAFKQIDDFIAGQNQIVELDIPEVENRAAALKFAKSVKTRALRAIKKHEYAFNRAQNAMSDSVVFDITERDSVAGVTRRVSLIYNTQTGEARFFVVGFDYKEGHPLAYDSTDVTADLNFTLFNDSDDQLISLKNLKKYKEGLGLTKSLN